MYQESNLIESNWSMDYRSGHQQVWLSEVSDIIDVKLIAKRNVMQII